MTTVTRRFAVIGSLLATAGCATRTPDQCDPHNGGMFDYFACRPQYGVREGQAVDRVLDAEDRFRREQARTVPLQATVDSLNAQLRMVDAHIDQMRATRSDLERRLGDLQEDQQALQQYVADLRRFLLALRAFNDDASRVSLPPLPDDRRINAAIAAMSRARQALPATQTFDRWFAMLAKLGGDYLTSEAIKFVAGRILRDIGLDVLEPYVGYALTIKDAYDAIEYMSGQG